MAIRSDVDKYLSAIEAEGRSAFDSAIAYASVAVRAIQSNLGVMEGRVLKASPPARIWIGGPVGRGHIVDSQDLQDAVELEAKRSDNQIKLAKSNCAERQFFVYIDQINEAAWSAMISRSIPDRPPTLPNAITHVWAAAEVHDGIIVWAAEAGKEWRDLGMISRPLEQV